MHNLQSELYTRGGGSGGLWVLRGALKVLLAAGQTSACTLRSYCQKERHCYLWSRTDSAVLHTRTLTKRQHHLISNKY